MGKLLCYYYELVSDKAHELNIYTYELRSGSPAEKVFYNHFPKMSMQAITKSEKIALAELIVYMFSTSDKSGYINYIHEIKPLEFDPFQVQEYLAEIMNKTIPQSLVDEVETIYGDMTAQEVEERKQTSSIIGETNISVPEDDEIEGEN